VEILDGSEGDHTVPVPGDSLAEDLTGPQSVLPSINDTIDQLTADLAAFCIDKLERSVTLITEDHMGNSDDLEAELWVRFKS
jgi:hypothetical protein